MRRIGSPNNGTNEDPRPNNGLKQIAYDRLYTGINGYIRLYLHFTVPIATTNGAEFALRFPRTAAPVDVVLVVRILQHVDDQ